MHNVLSDKLNNKKKYRKNYLIKLQIKKKINSIQFTREIFHDDDCDGGEETRDERQGTHTHTYYHFVCVYASEMQLMHLVIKKQNL